MDESGADPPNGTLKLYPTMDQIEDLSKNEDVEHECLDNSVVMLAVLQSKDHMAEEVEDEDYTYELTEDHLDYIGGE